MKHESCAFCGESFRGPEDAVYCEACIESEAVIWCEECEALFMPDLPDEGCTPEDEEDDDEDIPVPVLVNTSDARRERLITTLRRFIEDAGEPAAEYAVTLCMNWLKRRGDSRPGFDPNPVYYRLQDVLAYDGHEAAEAIVLPLLPNLERA
jgi:hypothetical protein